MAAILGGAAMASIAATAAKAGAPVIAAVLRGRGGKTGAMAAGVIEALAGGLGTAPTPEAVAEAAAKQPERAAAVIRSTESERLEALAKVLAEENEGFRIFAGIVQGEQASRSLLQRIWRPLAGLAFTASVCFVIVVTGLAVLRGLSVDASLAPLFALAGTGITVLGGFVTAYSFNRTAEKKAGVA